MVNLVHSSELKYHLLNVQSMQDSSPIVSRKKTTSSSCSISLLCTCREALLDSNNNEFLSHGSHISEDISYHGDISTIINYCLKALSVTLLRNSVNPGLKHWRLVGSTGQRTDQVSQSLWKL